MRPKIEFKYNCSTYSSNKKKAKLKGNRTAAYPDYSKQRYNFYLNFSIKIGGLNGKNSNL